MLVLKPEVNMHPAAAQYKLVSKDCRAPSLVPFLKCKSIWSLAQRSSSTAYQQSGHDITGK
jgi:hypothetical protein